MSRKNYLIKRFGKGFPGLITGLAVFGGILAFTDLKPGHPEITRMFAVTCLMAIWWVSEALPLAVTALVPVLLFPLMGIMDGAKVSAVYFNHIIFLFIGGFMVALAMEKWNLHKRIALKVLLLVGISPGKILFGFMLATFFLSMWISNTSSTMMMIPIVISVIAGLEDTLGKGSLNKYSVGLLLGIAYASSIGGMSTLVGTPTNLVLPQVLTILFPGSPAIGFTQWFAFAFPISLMMFIAAFVLLFLKFHPDTKWQGLDKGTFIAEYNLLGKKSPEEKVILFLFLSLAFLWTFRTDIKFDTFTIPGWTGIFPYASYINDGTIAIFISVLLFILPSRSEPGEKLLDWNTANKVPWNIVLLFGGGFALALGFESTGLAIWFGEQLQWTRLINVYLILVIIVTLMSFLTELTSNVASTQILLPIFAALAVSSGNNPLILMIPVTLASSLAFMLPTATPPNAIIFGSGRMQISTMVRTGFVLNMIGIVIIVFYTMITGNSIFDIQPGQLPFWAR